MDGQTVQKEQTLRRDPDGFLHRSVFDLLSLTKRTVVITGGARGIGLAFAFACAEAGASVAILDVSDKAHSHFDELAKRFPEQKFKLYMYDRFSETLIPSSQGVRLTWNDAGPMSHSTRLCKSLSIRWW